MRAPWPTGCWICRDWQSQRVCAACVARFRTAPPRCASCALPLRGPACAACLLHPLPLDTVSAGLDYAPPWDRLILQWKHGDAIGLTPTLVDFMHTPPPGAEGTAPPLLLPVPSHPHRLRARGYSPPALLARALAARLALPWTDELLLRVIDTPAQARLTRAERLSNLRHAFALAPARHAEVAGRTCVLIDDVMTTGATLATLATLLRRAGAPRVHAWVLARTDSPL